jgi:hypothetical protein
VNEESVLKVVLQIVSGDQKCLHLYVYSDLSRQLAEGKRIWDKFITGHESLCCQYSPEIKCQSMQWKTSVSVRQNRHMSPAHMKAVLICFLIIRALFASSSFNKVREWTSSVTWKNWQYYLRLFCQWRSEFGLVLRPCITTMFVLTHHCTGDFGIKTVQLLTVCKTEECCEGPQISLLTFRDMKSITKEGFSSFLNGGSTHQVYCYARRLLWRLKEWLVYSYLVQLLQGLSKNIIGARIE